METPTLQGASFVSQFTDTTYLAAVAAPGFSWAPDKVMQFHSELSVSATASDPGLSALLDATNTASLSFALPEGIEPEDAGLMTRADLPWITRRKMPDGDVVSVVDISGDAVPDIAQLRLEDQPRIRYFSGASRDKIKTVNYLGTAWSGVAAAAVADSDSDGLANDPAIAVLAHKAGNGSHAVEVRRADDGALINKVFFLGPSWDIIDVAVLDDKNGDGVTGDTAIAVLGEGPEQTVRRADQGAGAPAE